VAAPRASTEDAAVRLTVAGCGTAVPDPGRVCSGYFLETPSARMLLDCGPGVVHHLARFGLPWQDLSQLALTHFHTDHIGDVPMLFFALRHGMAPGRTDPLTVIGPPGVRKLLRRMQAVFGTHIRDPGFPVEVMELTPGAAVTLADGVSLASIPTPHTAASVAYRIETPAGPIGYTGDTGPSDDVAAFLRGLEVLVAECSLPDDQAADTHLTPARLARMANIALPARLVVTHVYPQLDRSALPGLLATAGWHGSATPAFDGLTLPLYLRM
jgi:ribonuclease BN (tRNA processing enzyme)